MASTAAVAAVASAAMASRASSSAALDASWARRTSSWALCTGSRTRVQCAQSQDRPTERSTGLKGASNAAKGAVKLSCKRGGGED